MDLQIDFVKRRRVSASLPAQTRTRRGKFPGRATLFRLLCVPMLSLTLLGAQVDAADDAAPQIKVKVSGVEGPVEDNVRAHLSVSRPGDPARLDASRVQRLHRRAPQEIRQALAAFGYYSPTVESELDRQTDGWTLSYRIDVGPPTRLTAFTVALEGPGADDPVLQSQLADFPLREGDVLDHGAYESGKSSLTQAATELGFFDARFSEHRIVVDPDTATAEGTLVMVTGPRYRFGEVEFSDRTLDPELLRGYAPFSPGDPYRLSQLLGLESALNDSGYFSRVEVQPRERQAEDAVVPVGVELDMRKPSAYRAGVGFATDVGPRGQLGWERRYLNRHGHSAQASLELSSVYTRLGGKYRIPIDDPTQDQLVFSAQLADEETDTSDSQRLQIGAARETSRFGWRESLGIDYQIEEFDTGGDAGTSKLLLPNARWSRTWAENPIDPRNGTRVTFKVQGAVKSLASDVTFAQVRTGVKHVRALTDKHRVIARAEVGATQTDDFEQLPPSLRFYTGGDQTVRGFEFQELGPEDEDGDVIGGRYLGVASLEYEYRFRPNWGVAVFQDVGNAFDKAFSGGVERGLGVGVRWHSPVGPVRLDVARGMTEPGKPIRFHVVIGPDL